MRRDDLDRLSEPGIIIAQPLEQAKPLACGLLPDFPVTIPSDSPERKISFGYIFVSLSGKMENSLHGIVLDAEGNPLGGVKVTTGKANFTTKSDGQYNFSQADAVNGRVSVRFEKSGYFTLTRSQRRGDAQLAHPFLLWSG